MSIIEYHEGVIGWGPTGPFYTVFDSELRFLKPHMFFSVIIGLGLFVLLYYLNNKGKIKINNYISVIISLILAVLLFFIFAYFFPIRVQY